MSDPVPISFFVDDPCPLVHVYREHWIDVHHKAPNTIDGRPLIEIIPNAFLDRFCDVMERWRIKGKFSIVPAPAAKGDVVRGIANHDTTLTQQWLETARRRLGPLCDFCPEGITHDLTVDLAASGISDGRTAAGGPLVCEQEGESDWSQRQNRDALTPYLTYQLGLLKDAGIDCTGVTSPWVFGTRVETEYLAAIVAAQKAVYGRDVTWYFLHMLWKWPGTRPWIAYKQGETTLVSLPANLEDFFWRTIDDPRTDTDYILAVVDAILSPDGKAGALVKVLEAGGWPVILTHWQSLFSNGLETGLRMLDELAGRIERLLGDRVVWSNCTDLMRRTIADAQ